MVTQKNYAALPRQKPLKVKATASPTVAEAGETADGDPHMTIYSTVLTNDFISTWTTGEPGATIPWHSHSPEMYQVLFNVEGRCRWHYKDNEGIERTIDGNPGEVIYLPAGAENKVEVIGEEQHTHIGALKRPRVPRLEHLLGDTEGLYDHTKFPAALVYDDMNDRVVRQVDSALVD